MKILFYLNLLWALLALGCDSEVDGLTSVMSKNYIGSYVEADSIEYYNIGHIVNPNNVFSAERISLRFYGKTISYYDTDKGNFIHYSTLCGDTAYNQEQDMRLAPEAIADRWLSVTITYEGDYDARHPAGTSLNDIIRISYSSPYTYIKNGYQLNGMVYKEVLGEKKKLLSEMTPEDFFLMENSIKLEFISPPDTPAMGKFTMTWQSENKTVKSVFS